MQLEALVTIDPDTHLCSRCHDDLGKVTLAIVHLLRAPFGGPFSTDDMDRVLDNFAGRLGRIEDHLEIPDGPEDPDRPDDPYPEIEMAFSYDERVLLRLIEHRDMLMRQEMLKEIETRLRTEATAMPADRQRASDE